MAIIRMPTADSPASIFEMDFTINKRRPVLGCQTCSGRRGLTILELLVTSGMISLLTALLLPAVMAAREAARRIECTNHLRQIGLALHNYHDVAGCLPAAWQHDPSGRTAYGWAVPLLPFLDQQAACTSIDRSLCLSDLQESIRTIPVSLFLCPSDVAPASFLVGDSMAEAFFLRLSSANYAGVYGTSEPDEIHPTPPGDGVFINDRPIRFAQLERGLGNTLFVGERSISMFSSSWIGFDHRDEDAECRVVGSAIEGPNCRSCDECEFGSRHPGVSIFLFGDGRVQGISSSINPTLYQQLARRQQ
jgi:type II secretory pathway pseudopilin PulG